MSGDSKILTAVGDTVQIRYTDELNSSDTFILEIAIKEKAEQANIQFIPDTFTIGETV